MNNQAYQEPSIDIDLDYSNHLDNINLNDTNQDRPKLQVGDVFNDWKSIHIAVEAYAKHQGFVANKNHTNLNNDDKSITRCQEYIC